MFLVKYNEQFKDSGGMMQMRTRILSLDYLGSIMLGLLFSIIACQLVILLKVHPTRYD